MLPDPWQHLAVSHLRAGNDVIVSAPTGAGKTLVFELFVKSAKLRRQAVYTVPTRALANDKRRIQLNQLERTFGVMSAEQAHVAYALSAVAVRKLLDLRGAQATVSLLKALGRGTPFPNAFQQAISMRYEEFVTIIGRE